MTKAAITKLSDYKAKMQGAGISAQAHNEGMADKLAKDSVEVEKKNLTATEVLNSSLKTLTDTIKAQIKGQGDNKGEVGDKADKVKSYKGAGGAVKERVDDFKKLFTLRGFLDKTGIVKKGSTGMLSGIADAALEKREAKQQYVKDRLNVDKNYVKGIGGGEAKASKTFENQFEKGNDSLIKVQENNKAMAGLAERGFTDPQIGRSTEGKAQAGLEANLAKVDSRFREGIAATPSGKPRVESASKSASNVVDIDKFKKDKKEEGGAVADAMSSSEEELENSRLMASQTELLTQIEENTRGEGGKKDDKKDEKGKGGGGIFSKLLEGIGGWWKGIVTSLMGALSSIGGMLMSGISSAFKFLFNPKMLLKIFSKVLAPLAIVGALVSGIMDGFDKFMETGSITEALIAGLGGFLDFLTFGLIDAEVIKNISDWVGGVIDEYLIQPISNFFESIGEGILSMFDGFKNFEIPGFSVLGKQFGPWHPFKSEGGSDSGGGGGDSKKMESKEFQKYSADRSKGDMLDKEGKDKENSNVSPEYKTEVGKLTTDLAAKNPEMEKLYQKDKANLKPTQTMEELRAQLDGSGSPKLADKVGADSKAVDAGKNTQPAANVTTVVSNNNSSMQKSTTAVSSPSPRGSENPTNDYLRRRA